MAKCIFCGEPANAFALLDDREGGISCVDACLGCLHKEMGRRVWVIDESLFQRMQGARVRFKFIDQSGRDLPGQLTAVEASSRS